MSLAASSAVVDLSEAGLMTRARHGDRAAFGQVVRLFQDRLFNFLFRLVGDASEAAELTQETFARALGRISEYTGEPEPYLWLLRIGLTLAVAALRRGRHGRKFCPGAGADDQAVLEGLGRLETDYRVALVLRDIEQLDYARMSAVLSLPAATVKSRLFRARLGLRDELKV